jgi:hypothetical protein
MDLRWPEMSWLGKLVSRTIQRDKRLTVCSSFDGKSMPPSHLFSKLQFSLHPFGLYGDCRDLLLSNWKLPRHSLFDCCKLDTFPPTFPNSDITIDKKQSIVVLTRFRMRSFNSSAFANDPTLAEAEYIAWTQWELTYSVLASTFPPAQRSFLDLVTYYNSNGNYTERKPAKDRGFLASESIQMSTMNAKGTSAGSTPNGAESEADDFDDDSSQRMIIMKSQTYEVVTHDAASAMEPVARGMAIHDRQEMVDRDWGPIESKTTTSS